MLPFCWGRFEIIHKYERKYGKTLYILLARLPNPFYERENFLIPDGSFDEFDTGCDYKSFKNKEEAVTIHGQMLLEYCDTVVSYASREKGPLKEILKEAKEKKKHCYSVLKKKKELHYS